MDNRKLPLSGRGDDLALSGREGAGQGRGAAEERSGWVCENGIWRRETIHSMLKRLPGWDYMRPWIYQITIVCADRAAEPLGQIEVRREGAGWLSVAAARTAREPYRPEEVEARVALSPLGAAIKELFWHFGDYTPEIRPLAIEIMPEHLHFIVQVTRAMARPLGNAIGGFKTGCEKLYQKLSLLGRDGGALPGGNRGGALPGGNRGGALPGGNRGGALPAKLFAEGFQDSILFHAGQLENMFDYLADNPRRRAIKALWPDFFRVVGRLGVDLWLSPQGLNGVGARIGAGGAAGGGAAGRSVPRAKARGWFMALGNRFLLGRSLAQIQVSRSDFAYRRFGGKIARDEKGAPIAQFSSPAFEAKSAALLLAAKRGAVLLSPCVSDGEREIARLALAAELPLVALRNKGFSPLGKPSGRLFEACSDGRLLLLAPAAWPYAPGEKPMTRFDAVAMNRLCQMIADAGAAQVNYHGMEPANIDALAFAAAEVEKS